MPSSHKVSPMPAQDGLRPNDHYRLKDRGNERYSKMKNSRLPFVNSIRPRTFHCSTTCWCRSAAFSASSSLFDLNEAVKTDAIMACQVEAIPPLINADEVFGTHSR
jgi:hypothetical protein